MNIRIGKVSSVDYDTGMVKVTYPDLDEAVSASLPVFSFTGEYKMPPVGADVVVVCLSNGTSAGICLGRYWNKANVPSLSGEGTFYKDLGDGSYIKAKNGKITLSADKITLSADKIVLDAPEIESEARG